MKLNRYRYLSVALLLLGLLTISYNWAGSANTTQSNTSSVHTAQYLLQTAALLYEQKNIAAAKNILVSIDTASLTPDLEQNYVLQRATIALAENDIRAATVWLNESIVIDTHFSDPTKEIMLHDLRAKVFSAKKQHLESTKEYVTLLAMPYKEITHKKQAYIDALWEQLTQVSDENIRQARIKSPDDSLTTWIDLLAITKNDKLSKAVKERMIGKWKKSNDITTLPTQLFKQ